MVKNENEITHRIVRGVNVKVVNGKRAPLAFVILSKNRTTELETLKGNSFFQSLTLVSERDDKNVFRTKLNSWNDAETFVENAIAAAAEVGIGAQDVTVDVVSDNANTKTTVA